MLFLKIIINHWDAIFLNIQFNNLTEQIIQKKYKMPESIKNVLIKCFGDTRSPEHLRQMPHPNNILRN